MTTVVSPASSPVPVYNRSGTTIVAVTGGIVSAGYLQPPVLSDAVAIPAVSGETVAVVTIPSSTAGVVALPAGEAGDTVEIYAVGGSGQPALVYPSVGYSLNGGAINTGVDPVTFTPVARSHGRLFRLASSTEWQALGGDGTTYP